MSELISEDTLRAQYHECCEDFRQYGTLIWQGALVGITLTSGLVIASYQYLGVGCVRIFVLAIAFSYALAAAFILAKYRHYSVIRARTAGVIEDRLKTRRIQRFTKLEKKPDGKYCEYWHTEQPKRMRKLIQPPSTHWFLISSMSIAAALVFVILVANLPFISRCP